MWVLQLTELDTDPSRYVVQNKSLHWAHRQDQSFAATTHADRRSNLVIEVMLC